MPRRGPFPEPEKQNLTILSKLSTESGIGFNELWRKLKQSNISLSFTTLTKTLRRLVKENYVQVKIKKGKAKISKRIYTKTALGSTYEKHLSSKLGFSKTPLKRILKIREGSIKYNQVIFSNFPFTYELELSSPKIDKDVEENIAKFVGDIGETLIHNIAEIMNRTYSNFLSSFVTGSVKDAFKNLKNGLDFRLKMTLAFDGRHVRFDEVTKRMQTNEDELLQSLHAIKIPSQTELLGCWMLTLLSPLMSPEDFSYDLSNVKEWARLIENYGNRWRRSKGVPLLKKNDVEEYLSGLIQKGDLAIRPFHATLGLLEFKEIPEPQPEEFYAFLSSIFSGMKSILEEK